ncbi:MAG TPA: GH3 auxin-responsive promoter family protein [Stellaceae bacterium]|nr:GH3 auxin-responsive promoter family protein [Stellaceae bacterium]
MIDATPLLWLYARYRAGRLARQDAVAEQQRQLLRLVRKAGATRFGRDHGFAEIRSVAGFQAHVPLRRYEDMWEDYWRHGFPRLTDCSWPGTLPFFALTSGTTSGATKYIPCSREMNRSNDWAALDILVHHLTNRPQSRVLGGKSLMLGGSTALVENAPGIRSGDLSGIVVSQIPWWARSYSFPPPALALIADWEEKIDTLAQAALGQDIRAITGTPSWLLIFFERLFSFAAKGPPRLDRLFPNLELLIHGGVNFAPYRLQFEELLSGSHAELREVYPASEGFIAIADRGFGEGLRLIVDNGLFYEFVPAAELAASSPARHWLATAEPGVDYALVVSSCAGLWSYVLGDTVRLIGRDPPRLLVTGRTSYSLSAFGEHLTGEEIEQAVSVAAEAVRVAIADFAVGAVFPGASQARGGHLYVVEFSDARLPDIAAFARAVDERLCRANDDYRAHRAGGFGLEPPTVMAVEHGTFAAWMRSRGQLGGQHKVPRIIADPKLFAELRRFAAPHARNGIDDHA